MQLIPENTSRKVDQLGRITLPKLVAKSADDTAKLLLHSVTYLNRY